MEVAYKVGNGSYLFWGTGYRLQFVKSSEYKIPLQHALDLRLA